jgi:hypothetical protein
MSDMSAVIAPKSDQINADDLLAGDMTITITDVSVTPGTEQPVSMRFSGSNKFFRPCKSMCRVMVHAWGADAKAYIGRSLTLYRDPKVKWGGMEVGGIRIRAMSHIERDMVMMLSESKANRKPHKVTVLRPQQQAATADAPALTPANALRLAEAAANRGTDHFRAWFNTDEGKACRATNALTPEEMARLKVVCSRADNPPDEADPFGLPPLDRANSATDAELTDAMREEMAEQARREVEEQARAAGAA